MFVIPIDRARVVLYSEQAIDAGESPAVPSQGVSGWILQRFFGLLRLAEDRHRSNDARPPRGWFGRMQDRAVAWLVERVAEQRLLWSLRGRIRAVVVYPDDMTFDGAMTALRGDLQADLARHRRWLLVDGVALAVSLALSPLFLLIPGVANIPAVYFGFRVISHWLSIWGASHGLGKVEWTGKASRELTELRHLPVDETARVTRMREIETGLHLRHLSTFVARMRSRAAAAR